MPDREKVVKEYEDYVNSYISLTTRHDYEFEMHKTVLAMLKEQQEEIQNLRKENNSILTQFHEWAKEQKAVEPRVSTAEQRCGHCNKVIEMDGWKACPWCGKMIDWERWWQKNGTSGTQTGKPQENRRDG